jgi:hypothetical protein
MIGVVLAGIMLGPPLWFTEIETGYMYTGAFVGALIGFALCGLVSDWSAKLLTRLNGGVYEPEFRMFLVIPQLILGCAGLYGFGWTSADAGRYGWFLPAFWFAVEVAGMVCGAVASALYIVDAHRECLRFFYSSSIMLFYGILWTGGSANIDNLQATCLLKDSPAFSYSKTSSPLASHSRALTGLFRAALNPCFWLLLVYKWEFVCLRFLCVRLPIFPSFPSSLCSFSCDRVSANYVHTRYLREKESIVLPQT